MSEEPVPDHAHGGVAFAVGAVLFAPVWAVVWVLTLPARVWRRFTSAKEVDGK